MPAAAAAAVGDICAPDKIYRNKSKTLVYCPAQCALILTFAKPPNVSAARAMQPNKVEYKIYNKLMAII